MEVMEQPAAREETRTTFKHSEFVDVGDGAAGCEHARDGECADGGHFHAWVRLPNPYQHDDIRRKGLAAKARTIRALQDPESDQSVILDLDLGTEPTALVEELVARDWAQDFLAAQREVDELPEWEHVAQDREELARLIAEDGPEAEREPLSRRLDEYAKALNGRLDHIQAGRRAGLEGLPLDALRGQAREARVTQEADGVFMDTYNAWMWFACTYRVDLHETLGRPHRPMWEHMGSRERPAAGTMFEDSREVLDALHQSFMDLQRSLQRGN